MRVLVTGGTGFIGSHAVEGFLTAGHEVRLLARTPAKVDAVLGARGIEVSEVVVGDMTDPEVVGRALDGCEAVLHAAATVGVADGDMSEVRANVEGTRVVVGQAVEAGCDPILYTSSMTVLYPSPDPVLTLASPLGEPPSEYGQSKLAAERYVRVLQADGAPVTTFYLGGVYGPDQPQLDSGLRGIVAAASQMMVITSGGVGVLDVRDLARLFVAALAPGRGPRGYLAGGPFFPWPEWTKALNDVIGRECRQVRVPARLLMGLGRLLDLVKRVKYFEYPLTYEAAMYMTHGVPTDDSATLADLGIEYRPTAETLADSVRWLVEAGHLDPKWAPALAPPAVAPSTLAPSDPA
jgi:nucleoside-diphosphate-sugar epimerase